VVIQVVVRVAKTPASIVQLGRRWRHEEASCGFMPFGPKGRGRPLQLVELGIDHLATGLVDHHRKACARINGSLHSPITPLRASTEDVADQDQKAA
jgi:hypothetical protein